MASIINTRADLDALAGTDEHTLFMEYLKGSMSIKKDAAVYPDNYGQPEYTGDTITPIWTEVQDLSVIERFGFTAADFA